MRNLRLGSTITLAFLALSACARPLAEGIPAPTPTHEFRFGVPVETQSDALIAAGSGLRASFDYAEPLTLISAEQTTFGEYSKTFQAGSGRPDDLKVWLVIYFDKAWQAHPPGPNTTALPAFPGCMGVVIDAGDGTALEVGGPLQKGVIAGCDK